MYKKYKLQTITILFLVVFTLACASLQVGIVTPTSEEVAEGFVRCLRRATGCLDRDRLSRHPAVLGRSAVYFMVDPIVGRDRFIRRHFRGFD